MKNLLKKLLFVMVFCLVQSALCHADTFKGKIVTPRQAKFSSEQTYSAR